MTRLIAFLLFLPFMLSAQFPEPVKWNIDLVKINDSEADVIFTATIDDGWNIYGQDVDDGGPVPTTITFESNVELVGKAKEEGYKKEGMDALFDMNVIKFLSDKPYVLTQRIKTNGLEKVTGYLNFMCCDNEKCLPPTDVEFDLAVANTSSIDKNNNNEDRAAVTPKAKKNTSPVVATPTPSSIKKKEAKNSVIQSITASPSANISWQKVNLEDFPVHWKYGLDKAEDGTAVIYFHADMDKTWNIYGKDVAEGGPVPTTVTFLEKDGIELIGEAIETGERKEGMDPLFDMNVIKFLDKKPYTYAQKIKITDTSKPLTGFLNFMCCDNERCLAPTDVEFSFDVAKGIALIDGEGGVNPDDIAAVAANPIVGNSIDQVRPKLKESQEKPLANCGEESTEDSSLLLMFIFGFLGGLVALLTPCVFPMIPLTVSFFTKDTKRKGWWNGTLYGLSIIVIYVTIGLLITAIFGTEALNALSTNWIANTFFFLIFIFFAFSFFGFYELTLPSSWSNKSDQMADKGGLIGIFFMAFTLALVSFSCTGPIIGTALVESADNTLGPFIVMLGFSLALALPFGLFAAFPAWLNSLPSSGGWLNSVKVVLGFIELALAFKFLTVADLTSHWGILKYEVFLGIWILIALAMAAYGFGWIKFPHDSPIKKLSPRRWAFSIGSILLAIYLAFGFQFDDVTKSYKPLNLLSGVAPPVSYNIFLDGPEVNKELKAKYPSYSKCANNINCFKDYYEGLAYSEEVKKPILFDFTGHGCVNCRRTEDRIWSDNRVRSKLNDEFVLISLYVDDREELPEVLVSKFSQKKLRTVGSKWADFEITNFGEFSQPLYVVSSPSEQIISNKRHYEEGIEDYLSFLNCGLDNYRSLSMK